MLSDESACRPLHVPSLILFTSPPSLHPSYHLALRAPPPATSLMCGARCHSQCEDCRGQSLCLQKLLEVLGGTSREEDRTRYRSVCDRKALQVGFPVLLPPNEILVDGICPSSPFSLESHTLQETTLVKWNLAGLTPFVLSFFWFGSILFSF